MDKKMRILLYGYGIVGKNFENLLQIVGINYDILDDSLKKTKNENSIVYDKVVICSAHEEYRKDMLDKLKKKSILYREITFYTECFFSSTMKGYIFAHRKKVLQAIMKDRIESYLRIEYFDEQKKICEDYPFIDLERINYVYIETTTYCNLKCNHCFRTFNEYESKNKHMSFKLFKKIVDSIPYIKQFVLCPQNVGEPTLNPELLDMISYAKKVHKFHRIEIHTNLLSSTKEYYLDLFNHGLDLLIVSIDSFEENTLNKTRKGTKIEELIDNLTFLLNIESLKNKIAVRISISQYNEHELPSILKQLEKFGVQNIHLAPIIDLYNKNIEVEEKSLLYWEKLASGFSFETMVINSYEYRRKNDKCTLFEDALNFNVLGYLVPCCMICDHHEQNFGTIERSSLKTILKSKKYIDFKQKIYSIFPPRICHDCLYYPIIKNNI
ncbi:MAG: radical SAM protein [Campylobacterales bacterium]|nr:radical SAM protein [Campylobacterales bacterium]